MALLRYFTEFTYNVVLKHLLGLPPFQNLVLIVYDHINYDLRDYSAIIWAKQQEAIASTSDLRVYRGVVSIHRVTPSRQTYICIISCPLL